MPTSTSHHKERCSVRGIPAEQILYVWEQVAPLIKRALDQGSNYTLDQILEGLIHKDMQLWVYTGKKIHAALVTTIQNRGPIRWCLFLAAGGTRMSEWIHHLPSIESWAREQGCHEMRIYGRMGWVRQLREEGYTAHWTKMSKQL